MRKKKTLNFSKKKSIKCVRLLQNEYNKDTIVIKVLKNIKQKMICSDLFSIFIEYNKYPSKKELSPVS